MVDGAVGADRPVIGSVHPGTPAPAPVSAAARLDSIDVLRGLALLGILVMNIPLFAFTGAAMFSPPVAGGFTGANYLTWLVSHLLFDFKMMTIFSMLFGAGIVLFARKAIEKSGAAASLHYQRMLWLLLFGLIHAYIIWEGDILVMYALMGMIAYPAWRLPAKWALSIGLVLIVIGGLLTSGQGVLYDHMRSQADQALALRAAGQEVPGPMDGWAQGWLGAYDPETGTYSGNAMRDGFYPTADRMEREALALRGSIGDRIAHRAPEVMFWQIYGFFFWGLFRVLGVFLLGMALFKWGVFSAVRSVPFYAGMVVLGFSLGWPLIGLGVRYNTEHNFDVVDGFLLGWQFNYVGSLLVAFGWVGLVMLMCKLNVLRPVQRALASVGRMAFTNYIMQSVICSFIFFGLSGIGLARFGELTRSQLPPIVLGIWAFQIIFSVLWLRRFRFGPLEWLWRSLTYLKLQPMVRSSA